MTSAAQSAEGSSAPNATIQQSRIDLNRGLVRESFDSILNILQQLSLFEKSPKLFIIYAHDNENSKLKAHQETVKKYISWFKKIRFNVNSDKSPHGYGPAHDVGHPGASNDIFMNQVCLLPRRWHKQNVDYVLVFYSELLASYMKYERGFKLKDNKDNKDKTYSDAIIDTCQSLQVNFRGYSQAEWDKCCDKIRDVQQRYSEAMRTSFHHVLTETALLSSTNGCGALDKTVPIILFGDEDWKPNLKWQPQFVNNKDTQIRITIKPEEEYRQFFKILLEFETLERDRPLIDVMNKCFEDSVKLLEDDLQPETYRKQLELLILGALRNLNHQWQKIERPITRGDIRSRLDLYSKLDCESIRRISGEKLLGNLNDIDLAVTNHLGSGDEGLAKEQREGRQSVPLHGLSDQEHRGKERQIVPLHGLSNEENKEEERQIVPLHGLFDKRNVGGKNIRPQRILIQGRPGIGKTTLCRRLMYEYSWHENLRRDFDLVVRIPLGKLEYSTDLNNLLFEEYFQAVSEGRNLSNKLAGLILDHENANLESNNANSVKIMIILDGLDEVRRWSQERRTLLEKLMQRSRVIITSRSHETAMSDISVDLHLEALGLSMMSVDAYLDNTEIVPSDTATEIHLFMESNAFIKDMVRVPIHLDILCYSWDELNGQNAPIKITTDDVENVTPRITALYQAVVRSLWRKDIPDLSKLDHGEPVTVDLVNAVRSSARLERLIHIESSFLEEIALDMMKSHRLEFTDEDIAETIQRLESTGNHLPLSLERNLDKLSLLRSSPSDRHRKYRFVHPTFQEFFAARYLARHLARDRTSFETLLRQHKYNRRYELVWIFFTGLLSKVEELDFFFDLLEDEPRDLVGIQHIRLLMYCLSECEIKLRPSRWDAYQGELGDWLRLELRVGKYRGIGSSMAFPEKTLREQLRLEADADPYKTLREQLNLQPNPDLGQLPLFERRSQFRVSLMKTVCNRKTISKSFIKYINQLTANRRDKWFYGLGPVNLPREFLETMDFSTMWMVEQGANLPANTISFIMEQMKLKTKLEGNAFTVLKRHRRLPDVTIKELVEWLKDPDLSWYADGILGNQANLSKETIDSAIENLFDHNRFDSWDRWDRRFERPVCLRQDLHAEAISKVWKFWEKGALRLDGIPPDRILLDVSRMHLLQPDHIERLGTFLEQRLRHSCIELREIADEALGQQASLATNVLKILVKLLRNEHNELFQAAQHILQEQPALSDDVIDKLRDLFKNDKRKVAAILRERLKLPAHTTTLLMAQIPDRQDAPIEYDKVVHYLLGQSDLPDYLVGSLPELIEEGVDPSLVAKLLGQQENPSNEVLNPVPKVTNQGAFAGPLINVLEQARSEKTARNAALLIQHSKIGQKLVKRLTSLLTNKPYNSATFNPAFNCLCKQDQIDQTSILELHDYIRKMRKSKGKASDFRFYDYLTPFWRHRHIEQFCANWALFDADIIRCILEVFLKKSVEDLAPAYIDRKTLYFYNADGILTKQTLENEGVFRSRFQEAQRLLEIPDWAWINPSYTSPY